MSFVKNEEDRGGFLRDCKKLEKEYRLQLTTRRALSRREACDSVAYSDDIRRIIQLCNYKVRRITYKIMERYKINLRTIIHSKVGL